MSACYRVRVRDSRMTWAPIIAAADRREAEQKVRLAMSWTGIEVLGSERMHPVSLHHGEAYAVRQDNGPERVAADIAAARAS